MAKKVYELANEIGVGALDLVEKLKSMGFNVRNHMASLTDEEAAKALAAYATPEKKASPVKKAVVRKVIKKEAPPVEEAPAAPVAKEEVTETPVTAKVAAPEVAAAPTTPAASAEVEDASKPKVVTVKRKTKAQKEDEIQRAVEAKEEAAAEKAAQQAARENPVEPTAASYNTSAKVRDPKKDYYEEKRHTFTPIFVPEEKKKDEPSQEKKPTENRLPPRRPMDESAPVETEEEKDKKRMGDLAAAIGKKGVGAGKKDLTVIRADEELKYASALVGKAIYTPPKKKKIYSGPTQKTLITEVKESKRVIQVHGVVTAENLAEKLSVRFESFANRVLEMNLLVRPDDYIGVKLAGEIAALYNYRVEDVAFNEEAVLNKKAGEDKSAYPVRNPIITIMGHVDHGKTSLLDYIRKEKVAAGEAGGITQHIGAYSVKVKDAMLTFLDTPGHAAFAAMRQRGANVTDIVVLVVAADDGVMPQTVESIRFIKNAEVPVIVAVNKIDKPAANPDKVKQGLTEHGLLPEEWGGETQYVNVSALTGQGIDDLLEAIQLQAEIMELRENPKGAAEGIVIESKIEVGRGPVTTILVQKGTLNKGDSIVVGETSGRARSLMDYTGKMLNSAGPSTPVQVLGLENVPTPGDILNVVKNEREAQKIVDNRIAERKALANTSVEAKKVSLEDFFATAQNNSEAEKKVLKLIIRSDVQGSYEAIKTSVERLGNSEVSVEVISGGVGAITDNDVNLAANSQGFILGFNMRPVTTARRIAEEKGVDIKTYSIIYELINDVTLALEGMLTPERVEKYIGRAQVKETFSIPKVGTIAGTAVVDGKIERGCNIRLLRDGKIIYDGKLTTLKRFKDEVKEVKNGYECGMSLENFNDIKVEDLIEAYVMEEKKRTLTSDLTL
ncbi:translation initiation factor IF-2 [Peredibacter starrii]|uniref:Translation initiation factor IF-2 n=1 Tax=Peredibacter starrii TaxID=28202 RepID=A0AAX4HTC2_9BACT|nr:translation initiation factor IF-2 [Peredibacter starrii]WPU66318.1 translation initiation factor IF-2 [Peredibacter starrii]